MGRPRNPDDKIEPMIVEHDRHFPTQKGFDEAVEKGLARDPEQDDYEDEYDDEDRR